ncbi:MAG: OmpA family protein [Flavobacteriales bacterium]|nr:OmpA family protein [Flavobacteriales bacterium]
MRKPMQGKFFWPLCIALILGSPLHMQSQDEAFGAKDEADHYFAKEGYYTAIDLYKKAYSQEKSADDKAALIYMVAESYRMVNDHVQAEVWYRRAIKARHDDPMAYYYLAKSLQAQGRMKEAQEELEKYQEKGGDPSLAAEAESSIELAQEKNEQVTRHEVDNLVMINSEFYDVAPTIVGEEGNTIYFTSSRLGSTGIDEFKRTGESYEDIFRTTRDTKGKWSEPERLPQGVNGYDHEGAAVLTKDGQRMYFTRCDKDDNLGCAIWVSNMVDDKWGEPKQVPLKTKEQEGHTVGHPALTPDGKVMLFASDLPGGQGGKDLWYTVYNDASNSWGSPVNLGSSVNTSGDEMFPHVRNNGNLYFASNGHIGMGGLDIFMAEKTGDNEWGNVSHMGAPINSISDDYGIVYEGDFERGYFSSNRIGGKGKDDIYSFSLPEVVFAFQGVVYDKDGQFPIEGAYVKVAGSDGSSFEALSDANGAFVFDANGEERYINPNVNYAIEVGKVEYLVAKDNISTVGLDDESTTFVKEFFIQSTAVEEIEFPEVQYDLGKYTLRPESKDSLDYLYQTLVDNPTIIIELAAHTDSRGSASANQTLSERRAQSCVDYLASKGIDPARMKAKGYGETKLRISDAEINALPADEREAAHQKNRRTVFKVLSWDYVPN